MTSAMLQTTIRARIEAFNKYFMLLLPKKSPYCKDINIQEFFTDSGELSPDVADEQ